MDRRLITKALSISVWTPPIVAAIQLPTHAALTPLCITLDVLCNYSVYETTLPDGLSYSVAVSIAGDPRFSGLDASVEFLRSDFSGVFNTPVSQLGCLGGTYDGEVTTESGTYSASFSVSVTTTYPALDPRNVQIEPVIIGFTPANEGSEETRIELTQPLEIDCIHLASQDFFKLAFKRVLST
ncbi:MAG: hypothetical protein AAF402_00610 [Pseudomonadota bacterium]